MQHVEFFHRHHFEHHYHRYWAMGAISSFIDFFWETQFDEVFNLHPDGFSDALFPNIGYTYLINLGTPFVMQLGDSSFEVRSDGFLPRYQNMICHHSAGNRIFGIKFKVSPVIFEKKIDFSEYREYIFPLAYLIDRNVVQSIKNAKRFEQRVEIATAHYEKLVQKYSGSLRAVDVVTHVLGDCEKEQRFDISIEEVAARYGISPRTLQRYFESTTSISGKQALQIMRIRKAVEALISDWEAFHYSRFGYYDYSHFYKHLRGFISSHKLELVKPHLQLLQRKEAIGNDRG